MVENENIEDETIPNVAKIYLDGIRSDRVKELGPFMEGYLLKAAVDHVTRLGGKEYTHVQIPGGELTPVIGGDGEVENKVVMTVEELENLSKED
jgi:hypothetical protein